MFVWIVMSFDFSAEMTDALVPFDKRCCWEKKKNRDSLTYIKRDRQACKGVHWRRNSRKTPQTPPLPSMGLRTHTHKSISVALRRFTVNSSITLALFVYFQSTTAQSPSLLLLLLQLLYIYWERESRLWPLLFFVESWGLFVSVGWSELSNKTHEEQGQKTNRPSPLHESRPKQPWRRDAMTTTSLRL